MTLRYIDGFDTYSNDADLAFRYDLVCGTDYRRTLAGGINGGKYLELYSDNGYLAKTFTDETTWVVGFRFRVPEFPSSLTPILLLLDSAGSAQCSISLTTLGALAAYRGNSSTILGTSSINLPLNAWVYVEAKINIHDTKGSVVLRVNGAEVLNLTNVDTKGTSIATARTLRISGGVAWTKLEYDDLYMLDTNGTTNNTFLGDVRVDAIVPTGTGSSTDFTPVGAAENWNNVDESPIDGDTSYNTSATVGDTDTFAFSNLPSNTGSIFGVQANLCARKDDAGSGGLKPVVLLGGTNYEGDEKLLSDNFLGFQDIWETNPATSSSWSEAQVNAAEFGYRVSS